MSYNLGEIFAAAVKTGLINILSIPTIQMLIAAFIVYVIVKIIWCRYFKQ